MKRAHAQLLSNDIVTEEARQNAASTGVHIRPRTDARFVYLGYPLKGRTFGIYLFHEESQYSFPNKFYEKINLEHFNIMNFHFLMLCDLAHLSQQKTSSSVGNFVSSLTHAGMPIR